MSVSLKESYDIAYDGSENAARMDLFIDTSADLAGLTHFDTIKLLQGSTAEDISTGDKYMMQSGGTWILQPSNNAFSNVYTKTEIDNMLISYYTKQEADSLFVWKTITISGASPLDFIGDGKPLISWSMKGNGVQSGTPTPDNPVMPEFVGTKTGNLFSADNASATVGTVTVKNENGRITVTGTTNASISSANTAWRDAFSFRLKAGTYYFSGTATGGMATYVRDADSNTSIAVTEQSFTLEEDTLVFIGFYIYKNVEKSFNIMINSGTTAAEFEPSGYKIPISCGGETTPIYIGEPLRKALDGSNAVDVLSSTGTITREVDAEGNALATPTTQTVDVPEIPTVKGQNTLTVDTTLQPSEVSITGQIRET